MNNSFLQMKKKMFLNNLNISYSFYISKFKSKNNFDNMITHILYRKQTELFQQLLKFDINTFEG